MTGRANYTDDGIADVSVSSKYSDKEVMHSFRDDVGKGNHVTQALVPSSHVHTPRENLLDGNRLETCAKESSLLQYPFDTLLRVQARVLYCHHSSLRCYV